VSASDSRTGEIDDVVEQCEQRFPVDAYGFDLRPLLGRGVVTDNNSAMPITPFIGVRISWLMFQETRF
jgi:hypothetical protein